MKSGTQTTPALAEDVRLEMRMATYCLRLLLPHKEAMHGMIRSCADDMAAIFGRFLVWSASGLGKASQQLDDDDQYEFMLIKDVLLARQILESGQYNASLTENLLRGLGKTDMAALLAMYKRTLQQLEKQYGHFAEPSRNIQLLREALHLSECETKLIDYVYMVNQFSQFSALATHFGRVNFEKATRLLGMMLQETPTAIATALSAKACLRSSGILGMNRIRADLDDILSLEDNGQLLLREQCQTVQDLMALLILPSKSGTLRIDDYGHVSEDIQNMLTYLRAASEQNKNGINILLYGAPGTGKTELARLLAAELGWQAYDVAYADNDGDALDGCDRFGRYTLSQKFLGQQPQTLLIFDEVEDVFPSDGADLLGALFGLSTHSKAEAGKAWVNDLLESTPVPSIWIANKISQIDPAYLRRFQIVQEIPNPPLRVRTKMVARELNGLTEDSPLIEELAQDSSLTMGLLKTVIDYVRTVTAHGKQDVTATLRQAVAQRKHAMGLTNQPVTLRKHPTKVSLDFLNPSGKVPMDKVANSLMRMPQATLCLYGPPGTGKTTFAEHVAKTLGRPLLIKRASDLLDMYVGQTEKAISAMFDEARIEKAVLLLDEADTFLRSRKDAARRWEASQTNELLQQMERFEGIFICATNLFEGMDEAALRRFSHKLHFDYLRQEQRTQLFAQEVLPPGTPMQASWQKRLDQLDCLTPGDFAVIKRQEKLYGESYSPEAFLDLLEEECAHKRSSQKGKPMGFLA